MDFTSYLPVDVKGGIDEQSDEPGWSFFSHKGRAIWIFQIPRTEKLPNHLVCCQVPGSKKLSIGFHTAWSFQKTQKTRLKRILIEHTTHHSHTKSVSMFPFFSQKNVSFSSEKKTNFPHGSSCPRWIPSSVWPPLKLASSKSLRSAKNVSSPSCDIPC